MEAINPEEVLQQQIRNVYIQHDECLEHLQQVLSDFDNGSENDMQYGVNNPAPNLRDHVIQLILCASQLTLPPIISERSVVIASIIAELNRRLSPPHFAHVLVCLPLHYDDVRHSLRLVAHTISVGGGGHTFADDTLPIKMLNRDDDPFDRYIHALVIALNRYENFGQRDQLSFPIMMSRRNISVRAMSNISTELYFIATCIYAECNHTSRRHIIKSLYGLVNRDELDSVEQFCSDHMSTATMMELKNVLKLLLFNTFESDVITELIGFLPDPKTLFKLIDVFMLDCKHFDLITRAPSESLLSVCTLPTARQMFKDAISDTLIDKLAPLVEKCNEIKPDVDMLYQPHYIATFKDFMFKPKENIQLASVYRISRKKLYLGGVEVADWYELPRETKQMSTQELKRVMEDHLTALIEPLEDNQKANHTVNCLNSILESVRNIPHGKFAEICVHHVIHVIE
jgi:hypothetical protein